MLGLAFQVQDDYLGIWGDAELTGKPVDSDLVQGKKSLPVFFGLERRGAFYRRWIQDQARDGVVRLAVPKKVLAAQLGMAPETLSRQLRSLQERGLIEAGSREIRILA